MTTGNLDNAGCGPVSGMCPRVRMNLKYDGVLQVEVCEKVGRWKEKEVGSRSRRRYYIVGPGNSKNSDQPYHSNVTNDSQ